MADGLDDVPLILNATLRDDFAKAVVAAQITHKGLYAITSEKVLDARDQRHFTILWAYKIADEMLLARDGKLPMPMPKK